MKKILLFAMIGSWLLPSLGTAGVSVRPKYLFLDGTRRSVPIYVTNPSAEANEVWIEMKFGYVGTNDSGRVEVIYDTLATDEPSAASWVKAYPQRFVIEAGETQTVRLVALPPPGLREGEYWARIEVNGKPRRGTQSANPNLQNLKSGVIFISRVGLAFHYRQGKVTTGVQIGNMRASAVGQNIEVAMDLVREGNASFWGTARLQIIDEAGRVVSSVLKNSVIYKRFLFRELIERKAIPSGRYTVTVEFLSGKRNDIENATLVQAPPVRASTTLELP